MSKFRSRIVNHHRQSPFHQVDVGARARTAEMILTNFEANGRVCVVGKPVPLRDLIVDRELIRCWFLMDAHQSSND